MYNIWTTVYILKEQEKELEIEVMILFPWISIESWEYARYSKPTLTISAPRIYGREIVLVAEIVLVIYSELGL